MKSLLISIVCLCGLFFGSTSAFTQEYQSSDIYGTPKTLTNFFGGYVGGDGDSASGWIDWSIGNCRPFSLPRTEDMVFSTNIGEFENPDDWFERMRITNNGMVGIGGIIPTQRLDVIGNVVADGISLSRDNDHRGAIWFATAGDFNLAMYNNLSNIDGEGVWDGTKWNVLSGLDIRVGSGTTKTSALFVRGDGNFGLGTTWPESRLHVNGPIQLEEGPEPPTPARGFILFVDEVDGALKAKSNLGNVTVLAAE